MFLWLMRLLRQTLSPWLARGQHTPLGLGDISRVAQHFRQGWRGPDRPPGDPRAFVRQPKPYRPYDRTGAIAMAEPDESEMVSAVAAHPPRRTRRIP